MAARSLPDRADPRPRGRRCRGRAASRPGRRSRRRRRQLVDRHLAGDVLRAEALERRAAPLVAAVRAHPLGPGPLGESVGGGRVVERDDPTPGPASAMASRTQAAAAAWRGMRAPTAASTSPAVGRRERAPRRGRRRRGPRAPRPSRRPVRSRSPNGRLSRSSLARTTHGPGRRGRSRQAHHDRPGGGGRPASVVVVGVGQAGERRRRRLERQVLGVAGRAARPTARRARSAARGAHRGSAARTDRASVPGPAPASTTVNTVGLGPPRPTRRRGPGRPPRRTAGPTSGLVRKSPRRPARRRSRRSRPRVRTAPAPPPRRTGSARGAAISARTAASTGVTGRPRRGAGRARHGPRRGSQRRSTRSSPPAARAAADGDVEPEPRGSSGAGAAVEDEVAVRDAGAAILHDETDPSVSGRDGQGVRRAFRRVGEHVPEEHVHRGLRRPPSDSRTRCGPSGSTVLVHRRPSSSASAPQNAARSAVTRARSHRTVMLSCNGRRAARMQLGDLGLQAIDVLDQRRGAVPFGVEPQGGQRCAEPMGQIGHALALRRQQLVDPIGQQVEGLGHGGDLRRAGHDGPGRGVAAGQVSARAGEVGGRARHAPGQAVGDGHRRRDQQEGHPGEHRPRLRHPLGDVCRRAPGLAARRRRRC